MTLYHQPSAISLSSDRLLSPWGAQGLTASALNTIGKDAETRHADPGPPTSPWIGQSAALSTAKGFIRRPRSPRSEASPIARNLNGLDLLARASHGIFLGQTFFLPLISYRQKKAEFFAALIEVSDPYFRSEFSDR